MATDESTQVLRLSELRGSLPLDITLQNLLGVLNAKLELCARLPVFAYEAETEGHQQSALTFRYLEATERQLCDDLLMCLQQHLGSTGDGTSRQEHQSPASKEASA